MSVTNGNALSARAYCLLSMAAGLDDRSGPSLFYARDLFFCKGMVVIVSILSCSQYSVL